MAKRTRKERMNPFEAARTCFARHGYAGTSIAMICDEAGLKNGSVYNATPGGKAELADVAYGAFHFDLRYQIFGGRQSKQSQSLAAYLRRQLIPRYMGWMTSNSGRAAFLMGIEALVRTEPWAAVLEGHLAMSKRLDCAFKAYLLPGHPIRMLPPQVTEDLVFGTAKSVVSRLLWKPTAASLLKQYVSVVSASTAAALEAYRRKTSSLSAGQPDTIDDAWANRLAASRAARPKR